jgi:hypothetical protein
MTGRRADPDRARKAPTSLRAHPPRREAIAPQHPSGGGAGGAEGPTRSSHSRQRPRDRRDRMAPGGRRPGAVRSPLLQNHHSLPRHAGCPWALERHFEAACGQTWGKRAGRSSLTDRAGRCISYVVPSNTAPLSAKQSGGATRPLSRAYGAG